MLKGLFTIVTAAYASAAPTHAETARGMISVIEWGALVTTSSRTEASRIGDAFGNPNSIADVGGIPYIYGAGADASFVDIVSNSRVSLALSEAALVNTDGSANISDCTIGIGFGDPENPPCARIVYSGTMSMPAVGSDEEVAAKAALFARHPSFASYPTGHSFFVAKLNIDGIWLIDAYGGAVDLAMADYLAATPVVPNNIRLNKNRHLAKASDGPPNPFAKVKTARWMANALDWGFLSTTSVRSEATAVGTAFGNPYSFADVEGVVYFYASGLDASMIDLFTGNGTAPANPRASLALSEASYPVAPLKNCVIGGSGLIGGDPENPLCARLVLSGNVSQVAAGSAEEKQAKQALFARHPSFVQYPSDHGFFVAKLSIDKIWLIDIFGGAASIKPSDYFKV